MKLHPLTLADKPLFDRYAHCSPIQLSTYAFASLYIWRDFFEYYWTIIDNQFCVFASQSGDYFMPLPPFGTPLNARAVRESYGFMLANNRAKQIARIENVSKKDLAFFSEMGFHAFVKETEYLYETEALIQLRGNRYRSKRSAYNYFIRKYPTATLTPYQVSDCEDCLALYDLWQKERQTTSSLPIYHAMLEDSQHAHRIGLREAEPLGLTGRVVRINGRVRAYIFGYPLDTSVVCVLFEVADLRVKGLPQFIFREFCRESASYRWINTMADSGLENLRRVKQSYQPTGCIPSYNVYLPIDEP